MSRLVSFVYNKFGYWEGVFLLFDLAKTFTAELDFFVKLA